MSGNLLKRILPEEIEIMAEQRLAICKSCEHLREKFTQCGLCGCFMEIKSRFPDQKCPANKW